MVGNTFFMTKALRKDIDLKKIASGNEVEFEKLFKSRYSKLYRFAMIFVKSKVLADEVVMDVFYNVWNLRNSLLEVKNIDTYLFVSVRNLSYTQNKREEKYKFENIDQLEIQTKKYTATPENNLISKENLEKINHAIDSLPPKCKLIFKLIREEKLKKKEVADVLNISVKTIDNQLAIAVQKLGGVLHVDLSTRNYSAHIQTYLLFF